MAITRQYPNGLVDETHRQLTQQILQALQEIRYGSVEIIIHDSQVVQIERKEKIRIDKDSSRITT
ncbi:MAG: YezD family protein [Nitrospirota bacterium]